MLRIKHLKSIHSRERKVKNLDAVKINPHTFRGPDKLIAYGPQLEWATRLTKEKKRSKIAEGIIQSRLKEEVSEIKVLPKF